MSSCVLRASRMLAAQFCVLGAFLVLSTVHASPPAEAENPAYAIVEKHLAAIGARGQPAKIVDTWSESTRAGVTERIRRVVDHENNRSYQMQDTASGKVETGFDGKRAWRRAAFFRGYLDDNDITARALRERRQELSDYRNNGMKLIKLPDEIIDGKTYVVIESEVKTPLATVPIKFFYDPESFLLLRSEQGGVVKTVVEYSDFRQHQGRTTAFMRKTTSPQITSTTRVLKIAYDEPIEPGLFEYESGKAGSAADTQSPPAPVATRDTPVARQKEQRLPQYKLDVKDAQSAFEIIWKTVNESYWDATFHGKDWQAIRAEYEPLVALPQTNQSFHDLMNRMVAMLDRSHMRVTAPHLVGDASITEAERKLRGGIGIDMRLVEGELLVTKIDPDYADGKLLKVGDVIDAVDGKTPQALWAAMRDDGEGRVFRDSEGVVRAVRRALVGLTSVPVRLSVRDGATDRARQVLLNRQAADTSRTLQFEWKRIDAKTGYVRFNFFIGDLTARFSHALKELGAIPALIVDLRGNGGGIGDLAPALAGMLSDTPGSLGESKFRYDSREFSYTARPGAFKGKLIILIDGFSASTSEVFAGGLQHNKRATIVGETSAGSVLPSLVTQLPTGGALQYAISDFRLKDQTALEGRGVKPDVEVKPSKRDIIHAQDTPLARAIEIARS